MPNRTQFSNDLTSVDSPVDRSTLRTMHLPGEKRGELLVQTTPENVHLQFDATVTSTLTITTDSFVV